MKKILFAVPYFYPCSFGGTEKYVFELAKTLLNYGYEVEILVPTKDEATVYFYENLKVNTFQYFEDDYSKTKYSFTITLKNTKADIYHLHSISESLNFDSFYIAKKIGLKTYFTPHLANNFCIKYPPLVYYNNQLCEGPYKTYICQKCFFISNQVKWSFKSKIIYALSNVFFGLTKKYLKKRKYYFLALLKFGYLNYLKYCDGLVAPTQWIVKIYERLGFNNYVYIHHAIDCMKIRSKPKSNNGDLKFGYIGRISKEKGIDLLLNVFNSNKIPNTIYIFTFEDSTKETFFNKVRQKIKSNNNIKIFFNSELSEIFSIIDVLIVPSLVREIGPLVVLEAFCFGVPVVCTKIATELVVDGYNGLFFEPNEESLLQTIEIITKNRDLYYSLKKNISENYENNFENFVQEHIKIYEK